MLELAVHILNSKKAHFDPDKFEDRYENALIELIKAKHAGKPAPKLAAAAAEQRHQPDGCAQAQREGAKQARRQERATRAPARVARRKRAGVARIADRVDTRAR